jgi:hypothetical protein
LVDDEVHQKQIQILEVLILDEVDEAVQHYQRLEVLELVDKVVMVVLDETLFLIT